MSNFVDALSHGNLKSMENHYDLDTDCLLLKKTVYGLGSKLLYVNNDKINHCGQIKKPSQSAI